MEINSSGLEDLVEKEENQEPSMNNRLERIMVVCLAVIEHIVSTKGQLGDSEKLKGLREVREVYDWAKEHRGKAESGEIKNVINVKVDSERRLREWIEHMGKAVSDNNES